MCLSYVRFIFDISIIIHVAVRETSQTEETDIGAIIGGVVAAVFILSITTALTVILVVVLLRNYSTGAQMKYIVMS